VGHTHDSRVPTVSSELLDSSPAVPGHPLYLQPPVLGKQRLLRPVQGNSILNDDAVDYKIIFGIQDILSRHHK